MNFFIYRYGTVRYGTVPTVPYQVWDSMYLNKYRNKKMQENIGKYRHPETSNNILLLLKMVPNQFTGSSIFSWTICPLFLFTSTVPVKFYFFSIFVSLYRTVHLFFSEEKKVYPPKTLSESSSNLYIKVVSFREFTYGRYVGIKIVIEL